MLHKRGTFICYTNNIVRKGSAITLSNYNLRFPSRTWGHSLFLSYLLIRKAKKGNPLLFHGLPFLVDVFSEDEEVTMEIAVLDADLNARKRHQIIRIWTNSTRCILQKFSRIQKSRPRCCTEKMCCTGERDFSMTKPCHFPM